MGNWVLIWYFTSALSAPPVTATGSAYFYSKKACVFAAATLVSRDPGLHAECFNTSE